MCVVVLVVAAMFVCFFFLLLSPSISVETQKCLWQKNKKVLSLSGKKPRLRLDRNQTRSRRGKFGLKGGFCASLRRLRRFRVKTELKQA